MKTLSRRTRDLLIAISIGAFPFSIIFGIAFFVGYGTTIGILAAAGFGVIGAFIGIMSHSYFDYNIKRIHAKYSVPFLKEKWEL